LREAGNDTKIKFDCPKCNELMNINVVRTKTNGEKLQIESVCENKHKYKQTLKTEFLTGTALSWLAEKFLECPICDQILPPSKFEELYKFCTKAWNAS